MRTYSVVLLALVAGSPLYAQEVPPTPPAGVELVDRVVAVVGDTVLLLSDVQAELQQLEASGQTLPTDPAQRDGMIAGLIEQRVDQLVLLEAARAAGIEVQNTEVSELVDQDIQQVQQQFGSEAALRSELAASGLSLEQYRGILSAQIRDRMLTERFLQQRAANAGRPPVSDDEIRTAFETQSAGLGERPANVSFQQIIIQTEPTDSARAEALRTAEQVVIELQEGADFEVLARRYSEDPGSREHGGDLGWFRPGRMVPEFERAVLAMRPGQTSGIVESDFGFHIIRLERARGAERQARHILIRPDITDADRMRARERADSVATAARGGADFAELVDAHMEPAERDPVERVPLDRLPPAYATAYGSATAGDVVGPFELAAPDGVQWVIARLLDRQDEGAYSLDDVREQIRVQLQEQKIVEQLVAELRRGMYVNVML